MRFDLHWCESQHAQSNTSTSFALWPAPVNRDACFEQAGFTDFADADTAWEAKSEELLNRVLARLAQYGRHTLESAPLQHRQGLLGILRNRQDLPLREQVLWPMLDDSLPECVVKFGADAELRTGHGHMIYWITLPTDGETDAEGFVQSVADDWPFFHTVLDLSALLGGHHDRSL